MEISIGNKVCNIIRDQLLGQEVKPTDTFADHGFDSLDFVNVVMALEEEYGITIDERNIHIDMTIQQFIDYLENLIRVAENTNSKPEVD